ncbi:ASCH domain-containing protein [Alteribacter natronophilus]|uniref:ASCH domain-containing protein n=1 Tax=Alteribacter natronophilus TaxID=2583810 RepID=UPI00110F1F08|nr:ASCH domain-containing protein [Alteribacter natronophilus]TMW71421.1 ASCH domain-containing protein [Alteribacter natronophilus]
MKHVMGLCEEPFRSMASGRKAVEVRLYDEKRRRIKAGDEIVFTRIPGDGKLTAVVENVEVYPTFQAMFEAIPAERFDAAGWTIDEMVESMYEIYPRERELEWGTVALYVNLSEEDRVVTGD